MGQTLQLGAHREPLNVRFAPKATELLRRREMSRRAQPDMIAARTLTLASLYSPDMTISRNLKLRPI